MPTVLLAARLWLDTLRWRFTPGAWRIHPTDSAHPQGCKLWVRWNVPLDGQWFVAGEFDQFADALAAAQSLNYERIRPWHFPIVRQV